MKIPLLLLPVLLAVPVRAEEPQDFARSVGDIRAAIEKNETTPTVPGRPVKPVGTTPTAERVAAAVKNPFKLDERASGGLSKAVRDEGYVIESRIGDSGQVEYRIVTPTGFLPNNERTFAGVKNMRGFIHFIAWERDGMVIYQDLKQKAKVASSDGGRRDDFDIIAQIVNGTFGNVANTVDNRNRTLRGVSVLGDALWALGFSKEESISILERVSKMTAGGEYTVPFAKRDDVVISVQGRTIRVHPFEDGAAGR